jgi:ribosomal protein L37E
MAANTESVLISCRRCRAWPMAIHTPSHPRQGILATLLICKRCGHKVDGPKIHDEPHRDRQ